MTNTTKGPFLFQDHLKGLLIFLRMKGQKPLIDNQNTMQHRIMSFPSFTILTLVSLFTVVGSAFASTPTDNTAGPLRGKQPLEAREIRAEPSIAEASLPFIGSNRNARNREVSNAVGAASAALNEVGEFLSNSGDSKDGKSVKTPLAPVTVNATKIAKGDIQNSPIGKGESGKGSPLAGKKGQPDQRKGSIGSSPTDSFYEKNATAGANAKADKQIDCGKAMDPKGTLNSAQANARDEDSNKMKSPTAESKGDYGPSVKTVKNSRYGVMRTEDVGNRATIRGFEGK
jgi:hypothetical protein